MTERTAPKPKLVPFPRPATNVIRDERILAHLPLVDPIARNIVRNLPPSFELDDLRSAGYLGLLHAAERFDASRGVLFSTYARYRVRGAMRDLVKKQRRAAMREPFLEDVAEQAVAETLTQGILKKQRRRQLARAASGLTPRERDVIHLVFVAGETGAQIAELLGINPSRVSELKHRGLRRMRSELDLRGERAA